MGWVVEHLELADGAPALADDVVDFRAVGDLQHSGVLLRPHGAHGSTRIWQHAASALQTLGCLRVLEDLRQNELRAVRDLRLRRARDRHDALGRACIAWHGMAYDGMSWHGIALHGMS